MQYIWQHIGNIIGTYAGKGPLSYALKTYYKENPILGSKDRKILSDMAYCWYRVEKGLDESLSFEEKISAALFLCASQPVLVQPFVNIPYDPKQAGQLFKRIATLKEHGINFSLDKIFQHQLNFSGGTAMRDAWMRSMLVQPRLFIRVRKKMDRITMLLRDSNINYITVTENCLSLPNGAGIDELLPPDSYVVQDISSQHTGNYFEPMENEEWYDCCCGAGGKSILLKDIEPTVELTVSDKRESILHNLENRFRLYHHRLPDSYLLDVSDKEQLEMSFEPERFDGVICDVPCSGSGTWSRTPEQISFFDPESLAHYTETQRAIATNIADYIVPGGKMLYITCSVFKEENEEAVAHINANTELKLEEMKLINGIDMFADSMFIAVFRKP